jgi:hypothetical protein
MLRRIPLYLIFMIAFAVLRPAEARAFSTGKAAPEISGGPWINTNPLTLSDLRERVVLVEFWTYG